MKKSVALFFILTVFLFTGCKKEKSRICSIYAGQVSYAVGRINSMVSVPTRVTYKYSYAVSGVNFEGEERAYGIGQKDETLIGKQFVVIYSVDDPSNSDLNLNFLIESDSDFLTFQSEYSAGPPEPDYPHNCD